MDIDDIKDYALRGILFRIHGEITDLQKDSKNNGKDMVDLMRDYNSCVNDIEEMQDKLRSLFENVDALTKKVATLIK